MLKIQTTGLEQYAPGGKAVLKIMFIGGPGAGKTRLSSYWPKPIYADCEAGLASIADRQMPFVSIKNSQDMLDLLAYLKVECRRSFEDRQFQTVVIDTLDAFQRGIKDEWLQANPNAQSFQGFDAWGYLNTKMQMLLTRLLNLDMNVIVAVHYKDKTIREGVGEQATERQELMLQLSGDVKDSVFNDFDMVGWLGKYYEAVDGQRVEKRGLTFKSTPDKPFLKDRLHVTPTWMEIVFADDDYKHLFAAFASKLDELEAGQEIGEIPSAGPEESQPAGGVVGPHSGGGPLPPVDPRDVPLAQFDKPTLQKMARELGCEYKTNTIKAELIDMIEKAKAAKEAAPVEAPDATGDPAPASSPVEATPEPPPPLADAPATPAEAAVFGDPPAVQPSTPAPVAEPTVEPDAAATPVEHLIVQTEVGPVDQATGEMRPEEVAAALGGAVVSEPSHADVEPPASAPRPAVTAGGRPEVCQREGCDIALADQNQDYVKLSQIKYRGYLCNEHYQGAKSGLWTPPKPGFWPHELAAQAATTTD